VSQKKRGAWGIEVEEYLDVGDWVVVFVVMRTKARGSRIDTPARTLGSTGSVTGASWRPTTAKTKSRPSESCGWGVGVHGADADAGSAVALIRQYRPLGLARRAV
jgi:hypothetical protein